MSRVLKVVVGVLLVSVVATGCQNGKVVPKPGSIVDSGSSSGVITEDSGLKITGETVIGNIGDPCSLLTAAQISSALGHKVVAIARGKQQKDGAGAIGQTCSYLTDGPSLVGPAASMLGALAGGTDTKALQDGIAKAGGIFGVVLQPVDPKTASPDNGQDAPNPEIQIRKVTGIGDNATVLTPPQGGFAIAVKGTTSVWLMDLLGDKQSLDSLEKLLKSAYGKL